MATLIAMKNKAAGAINGDVSSDGLNAMLGDTGDLQSMLIQSIKKGTVLKGSTEEWVAEASDRAREILANIGKSKQKQKQKPLSKSEQFIAWVNSYIGAASSKNVLTRKAESISANIETGKIVGFRFNEQVLEVDLVEAFGIDCVADGEIVGYLTKVERKESAINKESEQISLFEITSDEIIKTKKKRNAVVSGQLAFELF